MKRSNDESGRGRCGSFESSGRKIAYTGLASEHNKGDERSFIKGKKFCPVFCRGASAAPRKIQFRARDEYAWNGGIQEWGRKYRYRFLMGRAKTRVYISDK